MPELVSYDQLPDEILVDPNVFIREIKLAFHDFTCPEMLEKGVCTELDRQHIPDTYDAEGPGLIAVANIAIQLAFINMTRRFDLTPEEAVRYGIYPAIDIPSLLPLLGCAVTKTMPNGETIECQERGMHPEHRADLGDGVIVTWTDSPANPDPETPEEAARLVQVEDAHVEALQEDSDRRMAAAQQVDETGDDHTQ